MEQVYKLQKMKITSNSRMYETLCHSRDNLLLFEKKNVIV